MSGELELKVCGCAGGMAALALVAALTAHAEALMSCPDCGRDVSRRALMCPGCGLRGEVIEAESARLAKSWEPPPPDDAVRADFGDRVVLANPMAFGDRCYIVMPLAEMVGLKTLTFSFVSTNAPIEYTSIEVADAQPLVRFEIAETNLLFKVQSGEQVSWSRISPMRLKMDAGKLLEERTRK